mmetsp:Transcript_48593/g.155204  ORF Transcript_48593/g.155204 Transcript_48593/m.155204 type:complete len:216 (+) Transcript_48593:159-806(+)
MPISFCLALMTSFLRAFLLCRTIICGLLRRFSELVLPPLRFFRASSIFSLKSVRPDLMRSIRAALVRVLAGAPLSWSPETASGRRPASPRSPSEGSSSLSDSEPEELISSALRLRPSCSSMDLCSLSFRSFLKSSELRTFSSMRSLPLASPWASPAALASPSPSLAFLAKISRPSIASAAWRLPNSGACTSPRLSAIVASRPRSERCSSWGCSSR